MSNDTDSNLVHSSLMASRYRKVDHYHAKAISNIFLNFCVSSIKRRHTCRLPRMRLRNSFVFILISNRIFLSHGFSLFSSNVVKLIKAQQPTLATRCRAGMDRSSFLDRAKRALIGTISSSIPVAIKPTNAIEFVPASPYFSGSYQDAVEILYAQRLAVDNIANVIYDGNMEEAGFKVMQLSAQTRAAGKIILDYFQQQMSGRGDSIILLRFLSCQKKFSNLLDLCDECGITLQNTLKGKLGVTAAAQIKSSKVLDETMSAYDDFLLDVMAVEKELFHQ
jgi:hypothetical protein